MDFISEDSYKDDITLDESSFIELKSFYKTFLESNPTVRAAHITFLNITRSFVMPPKQYRDFVFMFGDYLEANGGFR